MLLSQKDTPILEKHIPTEQKDTQMEQKDMRMGWEGTQGLIEQEKALTFE